MKDKVERERHTHLSAEFQRIAKRNRKAFLNKQCKEIEENNAMGKTRGISKKIGDMKGIFHARMGMIKGRNSKDLIEVEDITKRWQQYTELYKTGLNELDNHDHVIIYLEPDILECEVKWVLGSITMNKVSRGTEFQTSSFKSSKIMLLKC